MRTRLDSLLSILLTVAAIGIAASMIHREFWGGRASAAPEPNTRLTYVKECPALPTAGVQVGPHNAPTTIIEFADLECPFCRRFHEALNRVRERHKGQIRYAFVHFPLPAHRFARLAAHAAECANDQDAFMEFVDVQKTSGAA